MKSTENSIHEAVVLAGGLGTRLRPIVSDRPKPMALVDGKPFLFFVASHLVRQGIRRIVFASGHLGAQVEDFFTSNPIPGLETQFLVEETLLGTGGAIKNATRYTHSNQLLVLNGDSFCGFSLSEFAQFHDEKKSNFTLGLVHTEDASRFGSVSINANSEVIHFEEKGGASGAGLINAGVYLIHKNHFLSQCPKSDKFSLEKDYFPSQISNGIWAQKLSGPFLDIGIPEDYVRAETFVKSMGYKASNQ